MRCALRRHFVQNAHYDDNDQGARNRTDNVAPKARSAARLADKVTDCCSRN